MKKICIDDYRHLEREDIYDYISENETCFEITIKRNAFRRIPPMTEQDKEHICYDFNKAAYAGQKLFEISTGFNYWVPPACSRMPFKFRIEINDMKAFVDTLYYIICGYFKPDFHSPENSFETQVELFYYETRHYNFDTICWGLVWVVPRCRSCLRRARRAARRW